MKDDLKWQNNSSNSNEIGSLGTCRSRGGPQAWLGTKRGRREVLAAVSESDSRTQRGPESRKIRRHRPSSARCSAAVAEQYFSNTHILASTVILSMWLKSHKMQLGFFVPHSLNNGELNRKNPQESDYACMKRHAIERRWRIKKFIKAIGQKVTELNLCCISVSMKIYKIQ